MTFWMITGTFMPIGTTLIAMPTGTRTTVIGDCCSMQRTFHSASLRADHATDASTCEHGDVHWMSTYRLHLLLVLPFAQHALHANKDAQVPPASRATGLHGRRSPRSRILPQRCDARHLLLSSLSRSFSVSNRARRRHTHHCRRILRAALSTQHKAPAAASCSFADLG